MDAKPCTLRNRFIPVLQVSGIGALCIKHTQTYIKRPLLALQSQEPRSEEIPELRLPVPLPKWTNPKPHTQRHS